MRLFLIPDAPLEHLPSADAAFSVESTASGAPGESDARKAKKCFVWEVSPNIPLASPIHLLKIRRLFGWARSLDHLHLFRVLWVQGFHKSSSFHVGPYVDPSRTAYQLGLKEESALFLTSNPAGAMLERYDGQALTHADDRSVAALWNELLLLPLSTAALQWTCAGRDVSVVGPTNRRVWRTGGSAAFSRHAFAVATYPDVTVPESVKPTRGVGVSLTSASPSSSSSSTAAAAAARESSFAGETVLRWSVRVSYRAVPSPGQGSAKPSATVARQGLADWPPPLPSDAFFEDDSATERVAVAVGVPGTRATPSHDDGAHQDDVEAPVVHPKQRKASVFVRSAEDDSDPETLQGVDSHAQRLSEGTSMAKDTEDDDNDVAEEDERVGVPLPSVLVGLGVRTVVEEYQELMEQQPSSSNNTHHTSDTQQPLYLATQLRDALCMVELSTGAIYASTVSKQLLGWTELESGSCCDVDTTLTFVVDCVSGSVNLYDHNSVMVAAFMLPSGFVELVHESASRSSVSTGRDRWLSPEAAAVVPVVQLGSVGAVIDIF